MPIEFSCPACHQLVRTPDAAAGKKGRCPQCQAVVLIPGVAVPRSNSPPVKSKPAEAAAAKPAPVRAAPQPAPAKSAPAKPAPTASEPPLAIAAIEFACVWCGELVRTPPSSAGKRGKCPHCQRIVKIPKEASKSREKNLTLEEEMPALEPVTSAARPSAAAKKPAAVDRPVPSHPPTQPSLALPASGPELAPAPRSDAPAKAYAPPPVPPPPPVPLAPADLGLVDIKHDELTPINDLSPTPVDPFSGLTPLPSADPSELTPLPDLPDDSLQTLTPLGKDNLAVLTPLPDDPLEGLEAAGSPLGYGGGYGAPLAAPRVSISDARRRGLPWEREPSLETFGETLKIVISAPHDAFQTMRRSGGVGNPLGFLIVSYVVAMMLFLVEVFLFELGMMLLVPNLMENAAHVRIPWEAFFIRFAIGAVVYLLLAIILATLGGFIVGGIHHLGLLMFGGANAGFEATYRVVAFGTGAVCMLVPIPLVGLFFAPIMYFVVLIYGLIYAHETTGGRAALAVMVPMFLMTCCLSPVVVILFLPLVMPR